MQSRLSANLEADVFLLGHLGNLFQQVLESLLSSVGDTVEDLCTELCHPKPPTWAQNTNRGGLGAGSIMHS